jgi:sec-independent protein translocase protein TatA
MYTSLVCLPCIGMPGLWEWVIIGLVVMIFFGAAKLPKLGKGLGEGIRNFKKGIKGGVAEKADGASVEKAESDEKAESTDKAGE